MEPEWRAISELSDVFRINALDILRVSDAHTYESLKACEPQLERVEVQIFDNDRIRARVDRGQPWEMIPSLSERNMFREQIQQGLSQRKKLLIVAGPGSGAELAVLQEAAIQAPNTSILVLERNPLTVLLALSSHDLGPLLQEGNVIWALGEPVLETLLRTLHEQALFLVDTSEMLASFGPTGCKPPNREVYLEAIRNFAEPVRQWREEYAHAAQRFHARLERRTPKPTRVWSCGALQDYTATPILRAFLRGLERHGCQTTFTELPHGLSRPRVRNYGLTAACPDTVFFLNDPTHLPIPKGPFHRMLWITEDPAFRKSRVKFPRYAPDELVLYADRTFEKSLQEQGAERRKHIPEFALLERAGEVRQELAYPIVFVGAIGDFEPVLNRMTLDDRDRLEEVYSEMLTDGTGTVGLPRIWSEKNASAPLIETARDMCHSRYQYTFADDRLTLSFMTYAYSVYRKRKEMAEALLPLGLHIYGSQDWLTILGDRYADRFHGVLLYEQLADVYRSAKVNVNIHSAQLPTALSVRDYDILAAGGCMLSDPVAEMAPETIHPERDCLVASGPEEFSEQARRLLWDDDLCRTLAEAGRATVLDRHMPEHRAASILEMFS